MGKKKRKYRRHTEAYEFLGLSPETKRGILVVILFAAGLLSILSFLGWAGMLGNYVNEGLGFVFGWVKILFPITTLVLGYLLLRSDRYSLTGMNYFGLAFFSLSLNGLVHLYYPFNQSISQAQLGSGGGWIGVALSYPLLKFTSFWAALIILMALFLISILITFNTTFENLAQHGGIIAAPIKWILYPFKKL